MAYAESNDIMNHFIQHIQSLPDLMGTLLPRFVAEAGRHVDTLPRRLHLIGCGDSYFAALATELAFESLARIPTEAQNAMTFSRYAAEFAPLDADTWVIGISVSGGVSRTIEGLVRARARGAQTWAITSSEQTPIARVAERVLITQVPDLPNAAGVLVPGSRSYYASLLMLYALALQLADLAGADTHTWRKQLADAVTWAEQTIQYNNKAAADWVARTLEAREFVLCGSGPHFATASFGAAKIIEACGDPATPQDVEEWAHLQYFCKAADTPTFLITMRERDASRVAEVRTAMQAIGRRVIEVSPAVEAELACPACPELLAPLISGLPLMLFAAHRAERLGEPYFRGFSGGRSVEGGGGISRIRTSEIVA